ncbi:MAG: sulfate ABC transporter substrate-binding protein [Boseongicola sp.]|nr:sulfate ABC transporter substrate-binding protein [Boseongicola sp.]
MIARFISTLFALFIGSVVHADALRLAVTTSFHNSGLSDVLLPEVSVDTGLEVQLLVVGTGQAIRLGQAGDVDAILVHARAAEDAFVTEGYGTHRREIMANDFVFVGPVGDPAAAQTATTASQALERIALTESPFVSRGDDSGTHTRERALWESSSAAPDPNWYRELGAGMGATLNTAAAMGAYTLTDRASWLNFGNRRGMSIVFEGDPALLNQYAYLPVSAERHPHVNQNGAIILETWLTSERGQTLIGNYRINGEILFTPNAKAP